jgi:glutaconyl-CoA/methylmalonyl-CoA decarboxylase subunit gamma
MRYYVALGGREIPVDVALSANGTWEVSVEGRPLQVDVVDAGRTLSIRFDGRVVDLVLDGSLPGVTFSARGQRGMARIESERMRMNGTARRSGARSSEALVVSPMPGRVIRLLVEVGQEVEQGTPLLVVEAMKMENELYAKQSGKIAQVFVRPGDTVEAGAKLLALAP